MTDGQTMTTTGTATRTEVDGSGSGGDRVVVEVPAPGELERLRKETSARANEDAVMAVGSVRAFAEKDEDFGTFSHALNALASFHTYGGLEDREYLSSTTAAFAERAAATEGKTPEEGSKSRGGGVSGAFAMKVSREDAWVRDARAFATSALDFVNDAQQVLEACEGTTLEMSSKERTVAQRLMHARANILAKNERIVRQRLISLTATNEREIRRYEDMLRQRERERLEAEAALKHESTRAQSSVSQDGSVNAEDESLEIKKDNEEVTTNAAHDGDRDSKGAGDADVLMGEVLPHS
jgi:hypothetical protein